MDAVYQLACHAFRPELFRQRNVQRYGKFAFRCHQPSRHVLRGDLEIGRGYGDFFSPQVEYGLGCGFDLGDTLLRELRGHGGDLLHVFAVARAQRLEVGLDALGDDARSVFDQFDLFDVHLVHDEVLYGRDMLCHGRVEHRDEDFGERLAHLDRHFAAQGEHH